MAKTKKVLENFGTDLSELAAEGKLDPVIGREDEIKRLVQILNRRRKNNPVLIGEPGTGKTAICEGLATLIHNREANPLLENKKIISIELSSIVAGTKYRGQFEERMKAIIKELKEREDVIVFLDEIHTLTGAGSAKGSLDAANILKPALARGDIQCIGATTLDEYRESIEDDGALDRRFQKVMIDPPSPNETLNILRNTIQYYEEYHNVAYTDKILKRVVKHCGRYITDRFSPDKELDIIDEVGSRVRLENVEVPEEIEKLEALKAQADLKKKEAVNEQRFEDAANYRDESEQIEDELQEHRKKWKYDLENQRFEVTIKDVNKVISLASGVPISNISQSEREKLLNLEEHLSKTVIGQPEAIDAISKSVRRSRAGVKSPSRPAGVFLFLGPTGVGKTHTAKTLAKEVFGSRDNLIRLDMSEYSEKHNVSRMVGSPPGYVGHEKGGQLTEKVRRKPYSVILLDEIEKAHPDVFNKLLQVFDDGHLTDGLGRTVSFKNCIIIMTSNIGAKEIINTGKTNIGFMQSDDGDDNSLDNDEVEKVVNEKVENVFAPEFINRLDDSVIFKGLRKEDLLEIVDLELNKLIERVKSQEIELSVTHAAKELLIEKGYSKEYGVRPLQRTIRTYVEEPVSEKVIQYEDPSGLELTVRKTGDEIYVDED